MINNSASHHPPKIQFLPPKAEKPTITAWGALVWAYADENVRVAEEDGDDRFPGPREPRSPLSSDCRLGRADRGKAMRVDIDAIAIDAVVSSVAVDRQHYTLIADAAEARRMIEPEITIQMPFACPEPDLYDVLGRPVIVIHPKTRRDWYCPIVWFGTSVPTAEILKARHRELYRVFLDVLHALDGRQFQRWRVVY